ncbi:MAG: LamG-like jellyroll fold domain-containing protein, partial [Lentisphaeria bacterium]
RQDVNMTALLGASSPGDLWELRVVTMDGGVFRSSAILHPDFAASPIVTESVPSETTGKPVQIPLRQAVHPDLQYVFRKSGNGWLKVAAPGCEDQYAILGGGCSVAMPFRDSARHPQPKVGGRPQWRSENGQDYLHFDGQNDYLIFPAAAIPYRRFRLSFRLRPESANTQFLMRQQGKSTGTIEQVLITQGCLQITLRDRASNAHRFTTRPGLRINAWNDVEIALEDGRLQVTINGELSTDAPLEHFEGRRANPLVFGGYDKNTAFFQGDLGAFRIR